MDLDINAFNFKRLRPGYWQKSAGAWTWVANKKDDDGVMSPYDVGSSFSATDLLKHNGKLVFCQDGEILPDN